MSQSIWPQYGDMPCVWLWVAGLGGVKSNPWTFTTSWGPPCTVHFFLIQGWIHSSTKVLVCFSWIAAVEGKRRADKGRLADCAIGDRDGLWICCNKILLAHVLSWVNWVLQRRFGADYHQRWVAGGWNFTAVFNFSSTVAKATTISSTSRSSVPSNWKQFSETIACDILEIVNLSRWWFEISFLCSPRKLGKMPILTSIFFKGVEITN